MLHAGNLSSTLIHSLIPQSSSWWLERNRIVRETAICRCLQFLVLRTVGLTGLRADQLQIVQTDRLVRLAVVFALAQLAGYEYLRALEKVQGCPFVPLAPARRVKPQRLLFVAPAVVHRQRKSGDGIAVARVANHGVFANSAYA